MRRLDMIEDESREVRREWREGEEREQGGR